MGLLCLVCELILVLTRLLFCQLLLLKPRWLLASVQASNHVGCSTSIALAQEVLVLSERLLREEMVGGRDLIVPVCLNAFDRVVRVVIELVQHHLVHLVVHWHWLLSWEETLRSSIFLLFEPGMSSDLINAVPLVRIGVEDLGDEMSTVLREELWQLVITCQYFLVQI